MAKCAWTRAVELASTLGWIFLPLVSISTLPNFSACVSEALGPNKLSHGACLLQVLDGLVLLAELPERADGERITRTVLRLDGELIRFLEGFFLVFWSTIFQRGLEVYSSSRSGW